MATKKPTTLAISLKGEIVSSNFAEFKAELKKHIASLVYTLKTDADFTTAEANVKQLKETEEALEEAKKKALEQAQEVQELFAQIDDINGDSRTARLKLESQIRARKAARRKEIVIDAVAQVTAIKKGAVILRIEAAIKGKRNFDTMAEAAEAEATLMQDGITAARAIIEAHKADHGSTLLPDPETLEWMDAEALSLELNRRLERQQNEKEKQDLKDKIAKQEADQKAKDDAAATKAKAEAAAAASAKAKASVVDTAAGPRPAAAAQAAPVSAPTVTRPDTEPESEYDKMFGEAEPEEPEAPMTAADELQSYLNTIKEAFGPVKAARAELQYVDNIERAKAFADAIAHAWAALTK